MEEVLAVGDGLLLGVEPDATAGPGLGGVRLDLDVPTSGSISKLSLTLGVTHTYISDLEITLSKDGVSKAVHNREGGSDDNINRTYNLDEFSGQEMSGRWTLHVKDLARLDTGKVKAWSLKITH